MATAAVIGLSAGKRLLSSSYYSDFSEKLPSYSSCCDHHHHVSSSKNVIAAKKSSNFSPTFPSHHRNQSVNALKEHVQSTASDPSLIQSWIHRSNHIDDEKSFDDPDHSVEAILLLQKSMLEKQWILSAEMALGTVTPRGKTCIEVQVTSSGSSARRRRIDSRRHVPSRKTSVRQLSLSRQLRSIISPELLQNRLKGYVKGLISEQLLTHAEVVQLSKKIKDGLCLEEHKGRLRERLGCDPSEEQLATSLKINRADLRSKTIECSLAREKLAMSNVRLVMSIAQRYDNMGAEMADLIQGGLIGLLRGIEKYDSSKGFKISTYVYWWIRQGVSRALVENSRTLRLPTHLHERLSLIRNAKIRLEQKGITPSIDVRLIDYLLMDLEQLKLSNSFA